MSPPSTIDWTDCDLEELTKGLVLYAQRRLLRSGLITDDVKQAAMDLVQDAFESVQNHKRNKPKEVSQFIFMCGIIKSLVSRKKRLLMAEVDETFADNRPSPEDVSVQRDAVAYFIACVRAERPNLYALLRILMVQQYSISVLAEMLNESQKSVKNKKKKLKRFYKYIQAKIAKEAISYHPMAAKDTVSDEPVKSVSPE